MKTLSLIHIQMTDINDSYREVISSIANLNTGVGTSEDQSRTIISSEVQQLSDQIISALYLNNRIIQKIIDLVPEAAKYAEISFEGDATLEEIKKIETQIKELNILEMFANASISARLFRESYIILVTDEDPENYFNPLADTEKLLKLEFFEFDQLRPIYNENHSQRTSYELVTKFDEPNLIIHESRVLLFAGKYLSNKMLSANNYVHSGILNGIMDSFSMFKNSVNTAANLLSRMVTFVYKMEKLGERLEDGGEDEIVQRVRVSRRGIGSVGGLIIDKTNEDVEWLTLNLGGVAQIIGELKRYFNAETDLTHDQLWNEGSDDTMSMIEDKNQRKKINNFITNYWLANFQKIVKLLGQGINTDNLIINFALREDEDTAAILDKRNKQATTDQLYINMGVLSPQEVRQNRFDERYSYETQITGSAPKSIPGKQNQQQDNQANQNNDNENLKNKNLGDANYSKKAEYTLTQSDITAILDNLSKENPVIFALLNADQEENIEKENKD